jgi:Protein of unknown function (DUF2723)
MGNWSSRPGSPALPSADPGGKTRTVWVAWFALFTAGFALYAATANRGAQWQDSGNHILRVVTHEPLNPLGLALSHPLHHWLGRFAVSFNLFQPCFAVTLVSALAAAIAVANTFGCVFTLTRQWPAAFFAALSLAVAHTFWQMATLAETYTLAAALLSGECWCLILYAQTRRPVYLWGALLLNGLGVSNHLLAALTTPVLVVVALHGAWRKAIRIRDVAAAAGLWLLGAAPYGFMVFQEFVRSSDLAGTLSSALFGHKYRDDVLNTTFAARKLLISAAFVLLNFPNLLLPVAAYGIIRSSRLISSPLVRRALLAGLVIHAVFVVRYPIVDQHTFFLPMYALVSIFSGIGLAKIYGWTRANVRIVVLTTAWGLLGLTPVLYAVVPDWARQYRVLESVERHKPYRDDYVYIFTPWSIVERSAERMSREAVALAGADGIIVVEDGMAEFAVLYQALRADYDELQIVGILTAEVAHEAVYTHRPVVLVPANRESPRTEPPVGTWLRVGDLYLLVGMP